MAKKDQVTNSASAFPTMGDSLIDNLINVSGNRSPYTSTVAKKTQGRGASPTGKAAVRGKSMIHEAHGPRFHISATLYKANAAEASSTQRNTVMLPPSVHREDGTGSAGTFWDKRRYANQGV